ncbi:MAG: ATP-binding cassette domain-containing protein [Candidatus Izemoplasmatales bacterium]
MIKLVNVSKYYNSNNTIALGLRKVNLELHVNEFVAIVGESGSGKTTLLNVISGIDTYEDGEIYINGEETSYFSTVDKENFRKKYVAFVFQNYNLIDSYTVLQNVEAPLILSGYPKDKLRARAMEIIRRVGLDKHVNHKATKLSGGQKQRVVIARALAKDCPIIAADEPTGNLDSASANQILELLHEISKEKLVIMVTHDFEQVKKYATRKIRIFDGEIVEDQELEKTEKENLPLIPDQEKRIKFFEFFKMALRNLLAVPKKSFLMILVFSFFAFIVALTYGSYDVSMNDYNYSYNYYFNNTSVSRIVVRKTDKTPLTAADIAELQGLDKVQTVVPYDYILDVNLWMYSEATSASEDYLYINGSYLPSSIISSVDLLIAGRMPTSSNEIVVALSGSGSSAPDDYLGRKFMDESNYYGGEQDLTQAYTVVGVLNADQIYMDLSSYYNGGFVIVTDELFSTLAEKYYFNYLDSSVFTLDVPSGTVTSANLSFYSQIYVNDDLADNVIQFPAYYTNFECYEQDYCDYEGTLTNTDYYMSYELTGMTLRVISFDKQYTDANYRDFEFIQMNTNTLDRLLYDDIYQVTVLTDTDLNVDKLIKNIATIDQTVFSSKYKVFYPYDSSTGDPYLGIIMMFATLGQVSLLVISVAASTLFTYVIFKAIINTKLHDYAIFRTIGANQRMIQYFIYLENLIIVFISFVIFLGISLYLKSTVMVGSLFYSLKMYTVLDYLAFFGIELLMSIIISRKYTRRVFGESVNRVLKAE